MRAPHFWSAGLDPKSREAAPLTRALLTPLAMLYTAVVRRKLTKAAPKTVSAKVICVGNLTTGGAGKTPIVAALRAKLHAQGLRAASLSRGYGGSLTGPLNVDPTRHTAQQVGDEPLLLARDGESWIARDRLAGAEAMSADGVNIIVMDDGHQNPSVRKDLSLVVIDTDAPFGNGYVLPKGPLREPVADGLARADAVLLAGTGPVPQEVLTSLRPSLRFQIAPLAPPPSGPLFAFAGIGRPLKFFDALKAAGADLSDGIAFDDHHPYSAGDLKNLRSLAAHAGARLITTAKDHARLPPGERGDILVYEVAARFEDEDALSALLEAFLRPSRR